MDRIAHPGALIEVVADVLDGLAHAHERGVTHRDVKPANILVDRSGRGRLGDFGIARIAGEAGLTTIGGLVGTVSYMAPEQARGDETGPAADVYSRMPRAVRRTGGAQPAGRPQPRRDAAARRRADASRPSRRRDPDLPVTLCRADRLRLGARSADASRARMVGAHVARANPVAGRRRGPVPPVRGDGLAMLCKRRRRRDAGEPAAVPGHGAADRDRSHWPPQQLLRGLRSSRGQRRSWDWWRGTSPSALHSPGLAMLVGALGLVALAPLRTRGRLVLLPAAAPLLAALGVVPVYAALAGAVRGWRSRIWAALTGLGATLIWQAIAGADPAVDGGRLTGAWADIEGVVSPFEVVRSVGEPLQNRPAVVIAAGVLAAASLAMPAIVRLRRGMPRAVGRRGMDRGPHRLRTGRWRQRRVGRGSVHSRRYTRRGLGSRAMAATAFWGGSAENCHTPKRHCGTTTGCMTALRNVEDTIGGFVERVFGRLFRGHVEPVELARKLAREMEDHKTVSVLRVYVPNEYVIYLSPADRNRFASFEGSLTTELGVYVSERARHEGFTLLSAPKVTLEADTDLRVGEYGIACRVVDPPVEAPAEVDAATPELPDPAPLPLPVAPTPPAGGRRRRPERGRRWCGRAGSIA